MSNTDTNTDRAIEVDGKVVGFVLNGITYMITDNGVVVVVAAN